MKRSSRMQAVFMAVALAISVAAPALIARSVLPPASARALRAPLAAYEELGSWIDMFDKGPWRHPKRTVQRMANRGAKTLFVQTSNYHKSKAIYRKDALGKMLETARRKGMRVIAWYVPGFARLERDWRRVRKAIEFTSAGGERFDGFAMDIEATAVADIPTRNRRMLELSDRLRDFVGAGYVLGAIIPDPVSQLYWPHFPYKRVNARYDVFLPMAYWTYRTRGEERVYRYARSTLRIVRGETGDRDVPIHVIGGIAGDARVREVRGFVLGALDGRAIGASLYDYPITKRTHWYQMRRINH